MYTDHYKRMRTNVRVSLQKNDGWHWAIEFADTNTAGQSGLDIPWDQHGISYRLQLKVGEQHHHVAIVARAAIKSREAEQQAIWASNVVKSRALLSQETKNESLSDVTHSMPLWLSFTHSQIPYFKVTCLHAPRLHSRALGSLY